MTRSIKATLLSALIFPGAGHVYLKQYVSAVVLISVAFASSYYLVATMVDQAMQIVDKIQQGQVAPDEAAISAMLTAQSAGPDTVMVNVATAAFVIVWLLGVVDAYRVGRLQDRAALGAKR